MTRHRLLHLAPLALALAPPPITAQELPRIDGVSAQPLMLYVDRLRAALDHLGVPLQPGTVAALDRARTARDDGELVAEIQRALDPLCLLHVQINPESRVKVDPGPAPRRLLQGGWSQFLVKVHNQAGVTARLRARSPQALPLPGAPEHEVRQRWLELRMFDARPLPRTLTGLRLEYRIVQLYSRDAGKRAAVLAFDVGQGTQDLGFRSDTMLVFDCAPSTPVTLRVRDHDGAPTVAAFTIRDARGHVYPSQAKRLAPDFDFHPQVYRGDGEQVSLAAGTYTVDVTRGPEYLPQQARLEVGAEPCELAVRLERWVDPAAQGWWSGDHHIHAAGCMHYEQPSEGVLARDMIRHCLGEDLKVGCNLTWGPCFDFQKQFFTGAIDTHSQPPYLLRYDIEVSGFGSEQSGHLCLLRLRDQIYPGGDSSDHWPTLGLNTLRWAQRQGAVCGPAHSALGLEVESRELPNYVIPPFDGIGANEYIVDVTHEVPGPDGKPVPAVDFLSTVDTAPTCELNIWYHTLNCGFRTRISGETDFPCLSGQRVGLGRSYVKLDGGNDYDAWCEGIAKGRCYVTEGRSHLLDFTAGGVAMGEGDSELRLAEPGTVVVTARVAALLPASPTTLDRRALDWHLERARIDRSREVPVEVVVNGRAMARRKVVADGTLRDLTFEVEITRSSWIALRILPSSHTNPVFVLVGDAPIRASRRSAQWCRDSVDQCWSQKERFMAEKEHADAVAAYDHARRTYDRIIAECKVE